MEDEDGGEGTGSRFRCSYDYEYIQCYKGRLSMSYSDGALPVSGCLYMPEPICLPHDEVGLRTVQRERYGFLIVQKKCKC